MANIRLYQNDAQLGKDLLVLAKFISGERELPLRGNVRKDRVSGKNKKDVQLKKVIARLKLSAKREKPLYMLELMKDELLTNDEIVLLALALEEATPLMAVSKKLMSPSWIANRVSRLEHFSSIDMQIRLAQLVSENSRLRQSGFLARGGNIDHKLGCRLLGIKEEAPVVTVKKSKELPSKEEIKAELDKVMIGQDRAKKVLATAAASYISGAGKKAGGFPNILMMGPTGSGKTYLLRSLGKILDMEVIITDATQYTSPGYVGDDVTNLIADIANKMEESANESVLVYIDEIDKIASKPDAHSRDVTGRAVQEELLQLLDKKEITARRRAFMGSQTFEIDTSRVLFVCGGAFVGLNDSVEASSPGFINSKKPVQKKKGNKVTIEQLVEFGMIPEFLGRLPVQVSLDPLSVEELKVILNNPEISPVNQLASLLPEEIRPGNIPEKALEDISLAAWRLGLGARGLLMAFEEYYSSIIYARMDDDYLSIESMG